MAIDKNYAPKLTEEEWENERRKALGGSDMSVVLGMSPFEGTRLSVYNEKIGKKAVEPMSDKTRVIFDSGHFLENMVADLFSYRTGYEAYEVKAMFEHPRYPYLRGNIDRFYRRRGRICAAILTAFTADAENRHRWDSWSARRPLNLTADGRITIFLSTIRFSCPPI